MASELSQGDILSQVIVGSSVSPLISLSKTTIKNSQQAWLPNSGWKPDNNQYGHYLSKGKMIYALVMSHDCEIDKNSKGSRILVSAVSPLDVVSNQEVRQAILEQRYFASMPLPGVPNIGDCYADLRTMTHLDRNLVDRSKRVASMTESARIRLQAQLIGFFTRRKL